MSNCTEYRLLTYRVAATLVSIVFIFKCTHAVDYPCLFYIIHIYSFCSFWPISEALILRLLFYYVTKIKSYKHNMYYNININIYVKCTLPCVGGWGLSDFRFPNFYMLSVFSSVHRTTNLNY